MIQKILVYCWGSLSEPILCESLRGMGIACLEYKDVMKNYHADASFAQKFITYLHQSKAEAVFSYDYFPLLSMICEINKIPYISWIYDCPQYTLLSKTLSNSCNYIFCFDRVYAERLGQMGAVHCYHYPLAGNEVMAEAVKVSAEAVDEAIQGCAGKSYDCDISFVGSLYNDSKNRLRQAKLSRYTAGYIDGLAEAQLLIYGYNFVRDSLPENVAEEVIQKCNLSLGEEYLWDGLQMAADVIGMEVTAREREKVLQTVGNSYPVCLYTTSDLPETINKSNVQKMGYADYQTEVPLIFHNSKINLNITSKTIESGIPQRVFDILSCGGFCLTNYQPEIGEYFSDGEELVMYTGMDDLLEKVAYYLEHDEERRQIAEKGYRKVMEEYGLQTRIKEMLETVFRR